MGPRIECASWNAGSGVCCASLTSESTQLHRPLDLAGRAILLAVDGSESAAAATRFAGELAKTFHARVHVVSVVDTRPAPIPPPLDIALIMGDAVADPEIHAQQEQAIRARLEVATGAPTSWPIPIMLGTPPSAIVREVHRLDAVLIVMGLRRHGRRERAVHDETVVTVMRHAAAN